MGPLAVETAGFASEIGDLAEGKIGWSPPLWLLDLRRLT